MCLSPIKLLEPELLVELEHLDVVDVALLGLEGAVILGPLSFQAEYMSAHLDSRPADDPQNYKDVDGVLFSHAFNRNYTVASPRTFEAFRSLAGLAVIRHYPLNENMMFDQRDQQILGYFVADIERAGPYCMMAEAHAMAHGDPTMIGYLTGGNFGRGFPGYVRNFNANFLALPALPSTIVPGAASDSDPNTYDSVIKAMRDELANV